MDKKILLVFLAGIFLFSFFSGLVSADSCSNYGMPEPLKVNVQGQLIQTCDTCNYVDLIQIMTPSESITIQKPMTKNGTVYNYSYTPSEIGTYYYTVAGDKDGGYTQETLCFEVTGSGGSTISNFSFFILIYILFYGLTFWGLKIQHEWVTLAGTFGLLILGVYTSLYGIGYYKDNLTTAISYITLLIGLGIGFETLREITYY